MRDAFKFWCSKKRGRILSYRDEKLRLEKYVISKIGSRQLDSITPPIVIKLMEPIEESGKLSTVKRLLMRTREIFDMSVNAGYLKSNPLAKITKVFPVPTVTHMPAVDWKELPIVVSQIENLAPTKYRLLFYFSLATLLRPKEVVSIRLEWINEDAITIPAEFMKMKRVHRVPLTPYLISLINEIKKNRVNQRSPYLFPAKHANKPISSQALAKWLHEQSVFRNRLVAHGLRSIGRSWFADQAAWNRGCYDVSSMSGSLSVQKYGTSRTATLDDLQAGDLSIGLDASKSSSLYGSSTTVQVSALFGQCLIRYA